MALTVTLTGTTVTLDETAGLQNDDTNTPLPPAFSTRLTALGADPATAINHAVSNGNVISISGGTGTITNLAFTDASGGALDGDSSGRFTNDGEEIFLFTDTVNDNIVLGKTAAGAIAFAVFLEETGSPVSGGKFWSIQFEALEHPDANNPDDSIDLNGNLKVAVSEQINFSFAGAPSGSNLFMMFGDPSSTQIVVIGKDPLNQSNGGNINTKDVLNISQAGSTTSFGVNGNQINPDEGAFITYVTGANTNFLVPNLDQNEADIEANIAFQNVVNATTASFTVNQTNPGKGPVTVKISAFSTAAEPGTSFVDGLTNDTHVNITSASVVNFVVNGEAATPVATVNADGTLTVTGLTTGDQVTWTTSGNHSRVLIENISNADGVSGNDNNTFDIGGFSLSSANAASAVVGTAVHFEDDGPLNNAAVVNVDVDEDELTGLSTGITDNDATTTVATFTGAQIAGLVVAGADEPVKVSLNPLIDNVDTGLDSKGANILFDVVSATQVNGVADGRTVFTLVQTAGADTVLGTADDAFTFTLLDQVDHVPLASGGGDAETIALSLASVFVATDGDGDSVVIDAGATVTIENDVPQNNAAVVNVDVDEDELTGLSTGITDNDATTTVATFTGAQIAGLVDTGADEPVKVSLNPLIDNVDTGLDSKGANILFDVVSATQVNGVADGRTVFTLVQTAGADTVLGTADDAFTFTLLDQVDHVPLASGGGDAETIALSLASVFVATDFDGDSVVIDAGATVTIENDVPQNNAAVVNVDVDEDELTGLSTGITDNDATTTVATFTGAQIAGLVDTGADEPVKVSLNPLIDNVDTGLDSKGANILFDVVSATQVNGVADGRTVFTLVQTAGADTVLGTADDAFTFTLLDQVDHVPLASGGGDAETIALSLASVFVATDFDGDSVVIDAGATVTIENDVPQNNAAVVNVDVDEDELTGLSTGITDNDATTTVATFTGAQIAGLVDTGADEPVKVSLNPLIDNVDTGLDSKGANILFDVVSATQVNGVADGRTVFTLVQTAGADTVLGTADDAFTFTLLDQVDHVPLASGGGDAETIALSLASVFVATDFDGDSVVIDAGATVTIENDVPQNNAAVVNVDVDEDELTGLSTGITDNDATTTVATFTGAQIAGLVDTGADEPVKVSLNPLIDNVDTGLDSKGANILFDVVSATQVNGVADGRTVFTLVQTAGADTVLGTADDAFTFTLLDQVDHVPLASGGGDAETIALSLASVFVATDFDGDSVVIDAGATVTIENDVPQNNAAVVNVDVDEDELTGLSTGITDNDATTTVATFTGAQIAGLVDTGADEPVKVSLNPLIDNVDTGLDSKGANILFDVVSATQVNGVADGRTVFTLVQTAGADTVLGTADDAFTFTLLDQVDHVPLASGGGDAETIALSLASVFVATDFDGDSVVIDAGATVTIENDVPQNNAAVVNVDVDEDELTGLSTGITDNDATTTVATFTGAQIAGLVDTGADEPVKVSLNPLIDNVDTGLDSKGANILFDVVSATQVNGVADGRTVFTLVQTAGADTVLGTADDAFTFTLLDQVDHVPLASGGGDAETIALSLASVFVATDFDGDSVVIDAGATVTIENDVPQNNAAVVNVDVDEDELTGLSTGITDNDATTTVATFTGAQIAGLVDTGADEPVKVSLNPLIDNVDTGLDSKGANILFDVVSATQVNGVADGRTVFTLVQTAGADTVLGTADDAFTFTLLDQVDHVPLASGGGDAETIALSLASVFVATDFDGDSVVIDAGATVTIENDVPQNNAAVVNVDVDEDELTGLSTGITDNDATTTVATFTGAQIAGLVDTGADEPVKVSLNPLIDNVDTGLDSKGANILFDVVSATQVNGVADGRTVFTLVQTAGADTVLGTADDAFTFTLLDQVDHVPLASGGGDAETIALSLASVFVATDFDGDSVVIDAGATVTIENDVPQNNAAVVNVDVDEDELTGLSTGITDNDATTTVATFTGAQIAGLVDTGADEPVKVSLNPLIDNVDTGLDSKGANILFDVVSATQVNGVADGRTVFTLVQTAGADTVLGTADDAFTFTLLDQVDHVPLASGGGDAETIALSLASVFVATDFDGDSVVIDAGATVTIENDVPQNNAAVVNVDVDEDELTGLSTGITDNDATTTVATFTGAQIAGLVDTGADEPVKVSLNPLIDNVDTGLDSKGANILFDVVSATQVNGVADGRTVFTLVQTAGADTVLGTADDAFTFTLLDQVDHVPLASGGGDAETIALSLASVFVATDFDGDSVVIDAGATVTIENDVPQNNAAVVNVDVDEDELTGLSTGITDNDATTTVATFTGAQIAGLVDTGADEPVKVSLNPLIDNVDTGLDSKGANILFDVVSATQVNGVADGRTVFTLVQTAGTDTVLGTADDAFTFTLLDQVDHVPLATGGGDAETIALSLASVFVATDFDGDSVVIDAGATVTIENDVPENNAAVVNVDVDEDELTGLSTGITDNDATTTVATFTGAQIAGLVDTGADEPVKVSLNPLIDNVDTGLDSKGANILFDVVSATQVNGVADGRTVFTLVQTAGADTVLGTADDAFTFTLLDQVDHVPLASGGGDAETIALSLASVFVATDFDGDSVVIDAGATVTIENDVPQNNAAVVNVDVDEDELTGLSTGITDNDATTTVATFTGAQIAGLVDTGADEPVKVSLNPLIDNVDTGLDSKGANILFDVVSATQVNGVADGRTVFTLVQTAGADTVLGTADDAFTFTLLDQVDHVPLASGGGDAETIALSLASVFVATDFDGDSVVIDAGATVTIENDVPQNNAAVVNVDVDEDELTGLSTGITDNDATTTVATFTGAQIAGLVDTGADEPVKVSLNPLIDNVDTGLDSKGANILFDVVSATQVNGVADGRTVFTLVQTAGADTVLGTADDAFTFTLLDQVDHVPLASGGGDAETIALSLASVFVATDFDGDSVVIDAGATVTIENDVPTIGPISDGLVDFTTISGANPGDFGGTSTPSVTKSLNGTVGADEPATFKVTSSPATLTIFDGTNAQLTLLRDITDSDTVVTYFRDVDNSGTHNAGDIDFFKLSLSGGNYTFDVLRDPPPAEIEFSFAGAPSGANLFMMFGDPNSAQIVVIGEDPLNQSQGGNINTKDVLNISQAGSTTSFGVNGNQINPDEGAFITYVTGANTNFLVPNLSQNEADVEANIDFGGVFNATKASFTINQTNPPIGPTTVEVSAFTTAFQDGVNFVDGLTDDTGVDILEAHVIRTILGVVVTDPAGTSVSIDGNGDAVVSGLRTGDEVQFTTDGTHNRVLIENISNADGIVGNDNNTLDIGGFSLLQAQPAPDEKLDFTIQIADFDGDTANASFSIGIDGTGVNDNDHVVGVNA